MESKKKTEVFEAYAVVAGCGSAGIIASYKLAKAGKKVMVLEKGESLRESDFPKISGFMGCETEFQKNAGITVASKINLYNYLTSWGKGEVNSKLIRSLLEHNAEASDLFQEMGLTYSSYTDYVDSAVKEKYLEDMTWGPLQLINEYADDRADIVTAALEKAGVEILFNCEAQELIMREGRVAGIKAVRNKCVPVEIRTQAVFLATGGFGNNKKMVKDWFNGAPIGNLGSKHNTGDGIRMALQAGAVMENSVGMIFNEICGANLKHSGSLFDEEFRMYNDNLGFDIYGGLNVDSYGDRFINEELMATNPLASNGLPALSVGPMYAIMDGDYYEGCCTEGVYKYMGEPDWDYGSHLFVPVLDKAKEQFAVAEKEGWAFKANTLAELAAHFKLTNLEDTVARYNDFCRKGKDEDFGKNRIFLREIKDGCGYYAFEYTGSYWCTIGGIKTDAKLRALNCDDVAIPGIYIGGTEMGSAYGRTYCDIAANGTALAIASGVIAADEIISYVG